MCALESFESQLSLLLASDGGRRPISVCVVAQDELLLAGCVQLLADSPGIELVRSLKLQDSIQEAWGCSEPDFDVLVLGVDTFDGEMASALAARGQRKAGLLLLVDRLGPDADGTLTSLLRDWKSGFACVLRRDIGSSRRLLGLIESVAGGHVSADAQVLGALLGRREATTWVDRLSPREREVLELMAAGLTNAAIAFEMHLELKTVERHINSIYSKIGGFGASTHPRVQAVTSFLSFKLAPAS